MHHADIIIPKGGDDEARKYYCELLGFKEIAKPVTLQKNGGLWLEVGGTQLHLSYEKKEGIDPRKTKSHLAYEVENLRELEEKLINNGFTVKKQTPIPGMSRFESEDPFGHRVEFLQVIED